MGFKPPASAGSSGPTTDRGTIAASTTYNPGDLVVYRGRRVLITAPTTSGSGSVPFLSAANYMPFYGETVVSAYDYGYRADGNQATASANVTALQNAINYANALGGGCVEVPTGLGFINGTVELKHFVWLRGQGQFATFIRQADGANLASMFKNHVSTGSGDANASFVALTDMTIDGNKANNPTGGNGVLLQTNPTTTQQGGTPGSGNVEWFDMHQRLQNLRVWSCKGDNVHMVGRSATQVISVYSAFSDGWNFSTTFDTNFSHCEAEGGALGGFYVNNGSQRFVACKAFTNFGPGYQFDSNAAGIAVSACEAQNNGAQGFYLNGCNRVTLTGCVADSNNGRTSTDPGTTFAGYELNGASYCVITGIAWQGLQGAQVGFQRNALRINSSTGNEIRLTHSKATGVTLFGTAIHASSDTLTAANLVVINGAQVSGTSTSGIIGNGVISPVVHGNTMNVEGVQAGAANRMHLMRVFVPQDCVLRDFTVMVGTQSGNLIAAVYDTGNATPGVRTLLWNSGSLACPAAGWQDLGDPALSVTAGTWLDVGIMPDNATATFGRRLLQTGGAQLPAGYTTPGGALQKLSATRTAGSFAAEATITEANLGVQTQALYVLLRAAAS